MYTSLCAIRSWNWNWKLTQDNFLIEHWIQRTHRCSAVRCWPWGIYSSWLASRDLGTTRSSYLAWVGPVVRPYPFVMNMWPIYWQMVYSSFLCFEQIWKFLNWARNSFGLVLTVFLRKICILGIAEYFLIVLFQISEIKKDEIRFKK